MRFVFKWLTVVITVSDLTPTSTFLGCAAVCDCVPEYTTSHSMVVIVLLRPSETRFLILHIRCTLDRYELPRGLRRGSAALRFLGLRVRIPCRKHGCLSLVCIMCYQVEVSAKGLSLVQRSATDCGLSECNN